MATKKKNGKTKTTGSKTKPTTTTLWIAMVVGMALVVGLVANYVNDAKQEEKLTKELKETTNKIKKNLAITNADLKTFHGEFFVLEKKVESIETLANENSKKIDALTSNQEELLQRLVSQERRITVHGKKTNDLAELSFRTAFGWFDDQLWEKEGKQLFQKYVKCGNQEYWDKVVSRIKDSHVQQILRINDINDRIDKIEKQKPVQDAYHRIVREEYPEKHKKYFKTTK